MKQPDNAFRNHFIIGGATDITNFGNEVVKHAAMLEDLEIEPGKIGCYFNQPNIGQKYADRKDYELLEQAAGFCFPAKKKGVLADIQRSIASKAEYIYIYISSHGASPNPKFKTCPIRSKFRMNLGGKNRCSADDYLFPTDLYEVLKEKSDTTPVFLVVQGCHTGGFISEEIKSLPNLMIMTASRKDRKSFGCSSAKKYTYFGGAFLKRLKNEDGTPPEWEWDDIYSQVTKAISDLETKKKIPPKKRSEPQMYKNLQE